MHWTQQIASCHQPCHRGFTAKITDSPNIVCKIKHVTEGLQHKILEYYLLHFHVQMEESKAKRRKTQTAEVTVYRA